MARKIRHNSRSGALRRLELGQQLHRLVPTAYLEVGELDIFRDGCLDYARRLTGAGVSVEPHPHPGCPHGFDRIDPGAGTVRRSLADNILDRVSRR